MSSPSARFQNGSRVCLPSRRQPRWAETESVREGLGLKEVSTKDIGVGAGAVARLQAPRGVSSNSRVYCNQHHPSRGPDRCQTPEGDQSTRTHPSQMPLFFPCTLASRLLFLWDRCWLKAYVDPVGLSDCDPRCTHAVLTTSDKAPPQPPTQDPAQNPGAVLLPVPNKTLNFFLWLAISFLHVMRPRIQQAGSHICPVSHHLLHSSIF